MNKSSSSCNHNAIRREAARTTMQQHADSVREHMHSINEAHAPDDAMSDDGDDDDDGSTCRHAANTTRTRTLTNNNTAHKD